MVWPWRYPTAAEIERLKSTLNVVRDERDRYRRTAEKCEWLEAKLEETSADRDTYQRIAERYATFERRWPTFGGRSGFHKHAAGGRVYVVRTLSDADEHIARQGLYISVLESQRSSEEVESARYMFNKLRKLKCEKVVEG